MGFRSCYEDKNVVKHITLSGMFLGLSIISSFILSFVYILGSFLTLDISIVFIIPIVFCCGIWWGLSAAIVQGLFTLIWSGAGGWIGSIILIVTNVIVIIILWEFERYCKIENRKIKWTVIYSLLVPIIMIILSALNGLLFTPLFWWFLGIIQTPSFVEASTFAAANNGVNVYLLGFNDYWKGIFALYCLFNFIKFSIVAVIMVPIHSLLIYKYQINPDIETN